LVAFVVFAGLDVFLVAMTMLMFVDFLTDCKKKVKNSYG